MKYNFDLVLSFKIERIRYFWKYTSIEFYTFVWEEAIQISNYVSAILLP